MSVYEHSLAVARMCLRIAKYFPGEVDMRSLVRGALLHDYFLYDWHIPDESHKWHGVTHAGDAFQSRRNIGRAGFYVWRIRYAPQKRQLKDIRISIYSCKNQRIYAIKY